jgi:type II secretory pathway component PulF
MTARDQSRLAGLVAGLVILAWFGTGLLLFYMPRLAAYWAETGLPPSLGQRLLMAVARFVQSHLIPWLPALLAGTGVVFWWRIHTVREARHAREEEIRP